MLMAELSLWPMDKGQSVGEYVARCVEIIDRSGLPYRLGPLGTSMEGDYDAVMEVIRRCHQALESDCDRIACIIKMDWRRGSGGRLDEKIRSVEQKVGRSLRK
jgi:uncharacterized protein (TIGR00106 family)